MKFVSPQIALCDVAMCSKMSSRVAENCYYGHGESQFSPLFTAFPHDGISGRRMVGRMNDCLFVCFIRRACV